MPIVEVSEPVASRPSMVYAKLIKMEDFPKTMANVESVVIRESGEGYTISEWVAKLQGARFRWVERDEFFPEVLQVRFDQVEGDLKIFRGSWRVDPHPLGSLVTLVTEFEFGVPMLASLLNPVARYALRQNSLSMVRAIAASATSAND